MNEYTANIKSGYTKKHPLNILTLLAKSFKTRREHTASTVHIERATDSMGNVVDRYQGLSRAFSYCKTNCVLTAGDTVTFNITAQSDSNLQYAIDVDFKNVVPWQESNQLSLQILEEYVSKFCQIRVKVRTLHGGLHEQKNYDTVIFSYLVKSHSVPVTMSGVLFK